MQDKRWFNPKGGGYFVEDARGRLRDAPRHNPDNLHIGESWYGGPLAKGNPRIDADNQFGRGWKKGWQEIRRNNRQGLEDWKKSQEPNYMTPLASIDTTPDSGSEYWGDDYYFPTDYIYRDTSDMYKDNPMRDDYYVQDPFSDIWGGQGGPLQFG
jgi:hypothetical protein